MTNHELRMAALDVAVRVCGSNANIDAIVNAAEKFRGFLDGEDLEPGEAAQPPAVLST